MTAAPPADRTPVSIITGFLGSGKTTLLNRLLQDAEMAKAAVIINEFGEIGLDHLLVTTPSENVVLLKNGCLCCSVRGDLVETLADLHARRSAGVVPEFDRVLVETTGLADPVPILRTLATEEEIVPRFAPDAVLTMVDAVNGSHQLDTHPESVKQAAVADRLLLTKTDLADAAAIADLRPRLARINPGAQLFEAVRGDVAPSRLFGAALHSGGAKREQVERWLSEEAYKSASDNSDHPGHHHDVNRHDEHIRAFSVRFDGAATGTGLMAWLNLLAGLKGARLLRVKGIVNVEGKPVVIHAVQSVIHEPLVLDAWPTENRSSRMVFITRDMARAEIESTFGMLQLRATAAEGAFDAEAYSRFVQAATGFRAGR
jgi:G3E family GTPase